MSFQERASEIIYAAGGRMTPQRRLLLDMLATLPHDLDAEGLYHLARQRDATISLTTVYRTLNILEAAGMLQPRYVSPDHERKLYKPVYATPRYYFTCRMCHKIIPFASSVIQALQAEIEAVGGVSVESACVCLNGLCENCKKGHQS